ncbi:MAG TPA: hypothetical protein VII78_11740 [Myxococcota bacterium]|jgi:hypothetical protein
MLRVVLITLSVLFLLRWFARLAAPRSNAPAQPTPEPRRQTPPLSAAERAALEQERERALREGRQIDAIELHRRLTDGSAL